MYKSLQFWLLSVSSFLFFSSFNLVIPILPAYMRALGGGEFIGWHITLFTLTAGLSRPFSGKMTDQWGRVPVMIIGCVVCAVISLFYPLIISIWGLLALRFFHGFSTGFKPTGTAAYVADIVPPTRRGEALGVVSFFGMTGVGMGSYLGGELDRYYSMDIIFYVSSLLAVLSILILAGMKETLQPRRSFSWTVFRVRRSDVYEPTVLRPAIVMLLNTFCFGAVITLYPDFSDHLGLQNRGVFFLYFTMASLVSRVIGGRMSDLFGRIIVLIISTLVVATGALIVGFAETGWMFIVGGIVFGAGYGLSSPTLFAWTIDLTPEENRGRGISTLFIALEIGIGVGALLAGTFYQQMPERFPLIFGGAAVLSFVAFLYLSILRWTQTR